MKIVHFVPFAPHRAGLYESTRDMIKAERLAGHTSELVDIGVNGKRLVGAVDDRGGCVIKTLDYEDVKDFDLFVSNCNIPKSFLAQTSAPVVQIMHGRPEGSFRLSQCDKKAPVYQIYHDKVRGTRTKMFITLWPEHMPFHEALIPKERLRSIPCAPCDLEMYSPDGPVYEIPRQHRGSFNVLLADSWREDGDPYNLLHCLIQCARWFSGMKVHVYSCPPRTLKGPYRFIFSHMKRLGILGELKGIMFNITEVYRAMNTTFIYPGIATRTLRESLACGTPVVGPDDNYNAQFRVPIREPEKAGHNLALIFGQIAGNREESRAAALDMAQKYNLKDFGRRICALYEEALTGIAQTKH